MKSWILEIRFDFGGQGSEAYKIFLARDKALSARIVFFFFYFFTFTEDKKVFYVQNLQSQCQDVLGGCQGVDKAL